MRRDKMFTFTKENRTFQRNCTLFTDGACEPNPGAGGWAFILRDNETGKELAESGFVPETTNNRMEMFPVIMGLRKLKYPCNVTLVSDSKYVINGISCWMNKWKMNGWNKKGGVKNLDLWQQVDELVLLHNVTCQWVKGHQGHKENEVCDSMATQQIILNSSLK